MSSAGKSYVLESILQTGLLPVFYNSDLEKAKEIVKACVAGGVRAVEFTNRGPRAYEVFSLLSSWSKTVQPDVTLGAGTIIDSSTAALFINVGAGFIVSPILDTKVSRLCNRRRIPYIPGCQTPTEISSAQAAGAELIKVFPAHIVTPSFIGSVLAPLSRSLLMPSGGVKVDQRDIGEWIRAGAVALNIGSELVPSNPGTKDDFAGITLRVQNCLKWIEEARLRSKSRSRGGS